MKLEEKILDIADEVTAYEHTRELRVIAVKVRKMAERIKRLEEAIRKTLDENRGLADGDDCTLHILKKALPTWN